MGQTERRTDRAILSAEHNNACHLVFVHRLFTLTVHNSYGRYLPTVILIIIIGIRRIIEGIIRRIRD